MIKKIKLNLRFALLYIPYLLIEILKSGISVCFLILFSKEPQQTEFNIIRYTTTLNRKIKKVLYASSITLTPGTFTIDIKDDDLLIIHAISCSNKNDKIDVVNELKQMEDKIKSI